MVNILYKDISHYLKPSKFQTRLHNTYMLYAIFACLYLFLRGIKIKKTKQVNTQRDFHNEKIIIVIILFYSDYYYYKTVVFVTFKI